MIIAYIGEYVNKDYRTPHIIHALICAVVRLEVTLVSIAVGIGELWVIEVYPSNGH